MNVAPDTDNRGRTAVLIAYYLTVALHVLGALHPEWRLWAFNWWAYMPTYAQFTALAIALVAPFPINYLASRFESQPKPDADSDNSHYWWWAIGIVAVMTTLFIVFRTRTHFLGDGYQLLSLHSETQPLLKKRNIGESLIHIWLNYFLSGGNYSEALLSFRIVAVCAGALYTAAILSAAKRLFERNLERALFVAVLITGGWALLFFGYVELYSFFILSTTLYLMCGILVAREQVAKWWLIVPLGAAIFFHILGVTLIPSTIYLLVKDTAVGQRIRSMSISARMTAVLVIAGGGFVALKIWESYDLYIQLMILNFTVHELTPNHYTLLSGSHLLDYFNLLFLLMPGLAVATASVATSNKTRRFLTTVSFFLIIASLGALGAVFTFDPGLGMPRDWDLFSYSIIPLALLLTIRLIENKQYTSIGLIVVCGIFVIGARTFTITSPPVAEQRFRDYLVLDPERSNPSGIVVLRNYFLEKGDTAAAELVDAEWQSMYPEFFQLDSVQELIWRQKPQEAMSILRHIRQTNPRYYSLWHFMGIAYTQQAELDSAIHALEIADALNPYSAATALAFANVFLMKKDTAATRRYLRAAWQRDSTSIKSVFRRNPPLKAIFEGRKKNGY